MAHTTIFASIGLAACFLGLATAILLFIIAASLTSIHGQSFALPLVAAIVQVFSCCTLATVLLLRMRLGNLSEQKRRRPVLVLLLGILPSFVATVVVGSALGWGEGSLPKQHLLILGNSVSDCLIITFVVWGLAMLAHLLYFVSFGWADKSNPTISSPMFPLEEASQQMTERSRSTTMVSTHSNSFQERLPSSPPSLIASEGTSSLRSSFSTLQRPPSSKKGFLIRQNSYNRHSSRSSSDGPSGHPSQEDGFDSWDTSAVSSQIRETVLQAKPTKGSGLEPIPGSRSPSPAKALEGPFFQPSPSLSPPSSPLPQPSVSRQNSPTSPPVDFPNFSATFPPAPTSPPTSPTIQQRNFSRHGSVSGPTISRSNTLSRSRAPSTNEDLIHPLFRSSSPTPPPSASANTKVTAAPGFGLMVNERTLQRMRSGSLPSTRSPLVRSYSSSDVRKSIIPPSPSLDTMPTAHASVGRKPSLGHQRERSASFESCILK